LRKTLFLGYNFETDLTVRLRINEKGFDVSRRPTSRPSDRQRRFKIIKDKNQNHQLPQVQHFAKNKFCN
jgi:hypothetical protein